MKRAKTIEKGDPTKYLYFVDVERGSISGFCSAEAAAQYLEYLNKPEWPKDKKYLEYIGDIYDSGFIIDTHGCRVLITAVTAELIAAKWLSSEPAELDSKLATAIHNIERNLKDASKVGGWHWYLPIDETRAVVEYFLALGGHRKP